MNLFNRAIGDTRRVVVHAKDKGRDRINVSLRQAREDGAILAWLAEVLVNVGHVCRVDRLHSDEDPLTTGLGDEVNQFLVTQQVSADLRHPGQLGSRFDYVSQQ